LVDSADLERACQEASKGPYIAMDTEFIRGRSYYPTVSLIQVASENTLFAIDMTIDLDYSPLIQLLCNHNILKVIHSAKQDLEMVFYKFQLLPNPIFDTQIGAMLDGKDTQISYDKLIRLYTGVQIEKNLQTSDWQRRPLTAKQIVYAINDVAHLYEAFPILFESLQKKGRLSWMIEECFCIFDKDTIAPTRSHLVKKVLHYLDNPNLAIKISLAIKICLLREVIAQSANLPPTHISSDLLIANIITDYIKKPLKFTEIGNIDEINAKISTEIDWRFVYKIFNNPHPLLREALENTGFLLTPEDFREAKHLVAKRAEHNEMQKNEAFYKLSAEITEICEKLGMSTQAFASTKDILLTAYGKDSKLRHGWRRKILQSIN